MEPIELRRTKHADGKVSLGGVATGFSWHGQDFGIIGTDVKAVQEILEYLLPSAPFYSEKCVEAELFRRQDVVPQTAESRAT